MKSAANTIGDRLKLIRGKESQKSYAMRINVGLSTYQNYERSDRDPDQRTLRAAFADGWNLNWLLTGEGPERLEAIQRKGFEVGEDALGYASHPVSAEHLSIALEMAEAKLQQENLWLPKRDFAELVTLILEKLQEEWSYTRIRAFVDGELTRLSKGESDAGSGQEVDEPGTGRVVEGEAQAPVKGDW